MLYQRMASPQLWGVPGALLAADGQGKLRLGVPLPGGAGVPLHGLGGVGGYAAAALQADGIAGLGRGIALPGGAQVKVGSQRGVGLHAKAFLIKLAAHKQGTGVVLAAAFWYQARAASSFLAVPRPKWTICARLRMAGTNPAWAG